MRVPDDVTLLLCDDNWGNIRKLPKLNENHAKVVMEFIIISIMSVAQETING
jgi:hypothetical protein